MYHSGILLYVLDFYLLSLGYYKNLLVVFLSLFSKKNLHGKDASFENVLYVGCMRKSLLFFLDTELIIN